LHQQLKGGFAVEKGGRTASTLAKMRLASRGGIWEEKGGFWPWQDRTPFA